MVVIRKSDYWQNKAKEFESILAGILAHDYKDAEVRSTTILFLYLGVMLYKMLKNIEDSFRVHIISAQEAEDKQAFVFLLIDLILDWIDAYRKSRAPSTICKARKSEWKESEHPRGQPENAGQFAPKGRVMTQNENDTEQNLGAAEEPEQSEVANNILWSKQSRAALEERTKTELGIEIVSYAGFDVASANAVHDALAKVFKRMPWLKSFIHYVGGVKDQNDLLANILSPAEMEKYRKLESNKKFYAAMRIFKDKQIKQYDGIVFNERRVQNYAKLLDALETAEDNHEIPEKCNSMEYVINHEVGHFIAIKYDLEHNAEIRNLFDLWFLDINTRTKQLSEYAWKNLAKDAITEFIAEALAEYLSVFRPRPIAEQVAAIVERMDKSWLKNI
jgi:hypothetical protein